MAAVFTLVGWSWRKLTHFEKFWAYVVLTKPDITFLVVITTVAGFCLGSIGPMDWARLMHTLLGTLLVAAGTAALNQYVERGMDAVMRRTAARPLPAGTLKPGEVLIFGVVTIVFGTALLALMVNLLAALIALATSVSYLGLYTPLKKRTTLATAVGAIPGALPPLIGWTAARGSVSEGGWILFAILFVWQFPHFMAIAWMYRENYARAGIQMLPVVDPKGDATFRVIVSFSAVLVPVSLLPSVMGMTGIRYFFGALALGMILLQVSLWANRMRTNVRAKWLMHATVFEPRKPGVGCWLKPKCDWRPYFKGGLLGDVLLVLGETRRVGRPSHSDARNRLSRVPLKNNAEKPDHQPYVLFFSQREFVI